MARADNDHEAETTGSGQHRIDWQATLAEHDRWLRTVLYARLRETDAVDEVMQEVALAAVRQAAPISDPSKVGPWLYRLAIRQVLMYRRTCGRRRRLTARYADRLRPTEADSGVPNPLGWLLQSERCRQVREALGRLSPRDSEILLLKYSEDWNYHMIAAHLGISHSAVETRLHRARNRLRAQLAKIELAEVE
jgi:RNA polymerase sigma-70 factor (ECF subfamily)